jgi:hypothetical protein
MKDIFAAHLTGVPKHRLLARTSKPVTTSQAGCGTMQGWETNGKGSRRCGS